MAWSKLHLQAHLIRCVPRKKKKKRRCVVGINWLRKILFVEKDKMHRFVALWVMKNRNGHKLMYLRVMNYLKLELLRASTTWLPNLGPYTPADASERVHG